MSVGAVRATRAGVVVVGADVLGVVVAVVLGVVVEADVVDEAFVGMDVDVDVMTAVVGEVVPGVDVQPTRASAPNAASPTARRKGWRGGSPRRGSGIPHCGLGRFLGLDSYQTERRPVGRKGLNAARRLGAPAWTAKVAPICYIANILMLTWQHADDSDLGG